MGNYLSSNHYDLVTPDGKIIEILHEKSHSLAKVEIENITSTFVGYQIPKELIIFNFKSTLAQLGLNAKLLDFELIAHQHRALCELKLTAIGPLAKMMLPLLTEGAYIGKLFAADDRRCVRDPKYLSRMFGRSDQKGRPLLSLGGIQGIDGLILEKIEGRTIAYLALLDGTLTYDKSIEGLLPTLAKGLHDPELRLRKLLKLHQIWVPKMPRLVQSSDILLVKTLPLHIRTVFARVVQEMLPQGVSHTSASVLQPDTEASGDVYELFGCSEKELRDIPLEFYTLEPHREHVFFSDRDQLQSALEDPKILFKAFETAPAPIHHLASVFLVKGEQLLNLQPTDWITREPRMSAFPGVINPNRQAAAVEKYIHQQPSYPFLKAIEDGSITSEGILLSRYFPSPLLKQMLLNDQIHRYLKRIYFQSPSLTYGDFFSHEDRSMLLDLAKFGIPTYWVDRTCQKVLQYLPKPGKDSGMFVPSELTEIFLKATLFGIYGSNLLDIDFDKGLTELLLGVLKLKGEMNHPLLNPDTPIALVSGGGPGTMSLGNRVAKSLGVLSCANIMDFRGKKGAVVNEQKQNPYIDAKMTYRLDKLVERQSEFNLDFPLFLMGGIGTDFEYALEEVRRKVGATSATPILLFGEPDYWSEKITHRFKCNLKTGTIAGSEWISNCFFCVRNASEGLNIYKQFFSGTLKIGPQGPVFDTGFVLPQNS
ncbi:MAG: LOG family protein [Rhabdochlamydiaceae bacterium]